MTEFSFYILNFKLYKATALHYNIRLELITLFKLFRIEQYLVRLTDIYLCNSYNFKYLISEIKCT